MASKNRESERVKDYEKSRILDETTRRRRLKKQLDALEQDNFQDDPHANVTWSRKMPKFGESTQPSPSPQSKQPNRKKRKLRGEHFKQRFRKTFQALEQEELALYPDEPNYFSAQAPSSRYPARHICVVCGFFSNYTCITCGVRYCSRNCLETHKDTRFVCVDGPLLLLYWCIKKQ